MEWLCFTETNYVIEASSRVESKEQQSDASNNEIVKTNFFVVVLVQLGGSYKMIQTRKYLWTGAAAAASAAADTSNPAWP